MFLFWFSFFFFFNHLDSDLPFVFLQLPLPGKMVKTISYRTYVGSLLGSASSYLKVLATLGLGYIALK